jgi:ketosteroid isomerase-like protein
MAFRIGALLVAVLAGCASISDAQEATTTKDLKGAIAAFYAAIEAGDAEARIDLLAGDVILMPNHWTIMQGKDVVAESFRRGAAAVFKLKDRQLVHVEVSGDLAYTVNSYHYTYHGRGEPEQWHKTKNVHVWRRDGSGTWKLTVDIWNSDVPIEQFSRE